LRLLPIIQARLSAATVPPAGCVLIGLAAARRCNNRPSRTRQKTRAHPVAARSIVTPLSRPRSSHGRHPRSSRSPCRRAASLPPLPRLRRRRGRAFGGIPCRQ